MIKLFLNNDTRLSYLLKFEVVHKWPLIQLKDQLPELLLFLRIRLKGNKEKIFYILHQKNIYSNHLNTRQLNTGLNELLVFKWYLNLYC